MFKPQIASATAVQVRALLSGEDATPFRLLNEEWITRFFVLEPHDHELLNDPETHILAAGGHIFFADLAGETVGCVALVPKTAAEGVYELSKMAVSPAAQGRGIGRLLLAHAIAEARRLGATSLFLGSSKKLPTAIHLYESFGFRHTPPDSHVANLYTRADVFMTLAL